ncbi:hypothetical protein GCM10028784_14390 [Myceligenerans cantabricum]
MPEPAKRVVIYVRHADDVDPGHVQEQRCRAWAADEGHEVVATFTDEAPGKPSDADRGRPAFESMLERVGAGDADIVVALSLDCLAQDGQDRARLGGLPADVVVRHRCGSDDGEAPWYIAPMVLGTIATGIGVFHTLANAWASTTAASVVAILTAVAPIAVAARTVARAPSPSPSPSPVTSLAPLLLCTTTVALLAALGFGVHPGLAPAGLAALGGVLAPVTSVLGALRILATPTGESWSVVGHPST